jgi:hypothetical protein
MTSMNPEEATRVQIARYQQMTGEDRLKVAPELACALAREGIRRQHPGVSDQEVETSFAAALTSCGRPMTEQELPASSLKQFSYRQAFQTGRKSCQA